jgi:hypothetical protein
VFLSVFMMHSVFLREIYMHSHNFNQKDLLSFKIENQTNIYSSSFLHEC